MRASSCTGANTPGNAELASTAESTVTLGEAMWLSSREVCLALEGEMVMLMLRPVLRYASRKVMSGMSRCISRFTACMSMLFLLPKPILMLSGLAVSARAR